jgi:hypothetical protein
MNIKDFDNMNEDGASLRDSNAILAVGLSKRWRESESVTGHISIYECGEEVSRCHISVAEDGEITSDGDSFFSMISLFNVLRQSKQAREKII